MLVIPVSSNTYGVTDYFNGALVFKVTNDDITLRGAIAHDTSGRYSYQSAVERSLYIEDLLYTKSRDQIRIHTIDGLDPVEDVELEQKKEEPPIYYIDEVEIR